MKRFAILFVSLVFSASFASSTITSSVFLSPDRSKILTNQKNASAQVSAQ